MMKKPLPKRRYFFTSANIGISVMCLLLFCCRIWDSSAEPSPSVSAGEHLNILFISSHGKDLPSQRALESGLKSVMNRSSERHKVFFEFMYAPGRRAEERFWPSFNSYLTEKYKNATIDYLIGWADEADQFLVHYPQLFPDAKRIYLQKPPGLIPRSKNFYTAIEVEEDYLESLRQMLALVRPKHLVVIGETTNYFSRSRLAEFKKSISHLEEDITLEYLVDLPLREIREKLATLPSADTAALYLLVFGDGKGREMTPYAVASALTADSRIPVFSFWESLLGSGIVGGYLSSQQLFGEIVGEIILQQKTPAQVKAMKPMRFVYDWEALEKWHIDRSRIPPEASFINRPINILAVIWPYLLTGLAFIILETTLIVYLVINRNRRKKAEISLKRHQELLERLLAERTDKLRQSNEELEESQVRYRSLSDAAVEGLAFLADGKILEINKAMLDMVESSMDQVVGKNVLDFVEPDQREFVRQKMVSGYDEPYEITLVNEHGGRFPVSIHGRTFYSKGKQVRIAAIKDLREIKIAQDEIRALQGILPICASCKKIRDDKGYWNRLEEYIEDHSDAVFSHGLCLECTKRLYGDDVVEE